MITKQHILDTAKQQGWVKREQFYSFSLYENPVSKGQYSFARLKKQKSKELRLLNRLFQELVLEGSLHSPHCESGIKIAGGFKVWILRKTENKT
jgi:hypothetical protein